MPGDDVTRSLCDKTGESEPAVALRGVWFAYNGAPVLEDVSFSVRRGESICMVGPNGGGKTTILKLILGLIAPASGEVRVLGMPPRAARSRIGYMPQHLGFDPQFPMTVMDIVLMGRLGRGGLGGLLGWYDRRDRRAALEALEAVGMEQHVRESFATLSGGQRQRTLIARALCTQPELLLLDEPTANVDTLVEAQLADILRGLSRRMTILMVSHDLGFVSSLVEHVVCVNRRVVVHPTCEVTGARIEELYGHELRLVRHDGSAPHDGAARRPDAPEEPEAADG
jgi:zinc transport system ATP-binding protein